MAKDKEKVEWDFDDEFGDFGDFDEEFGDGKENKKDRKPVEAMKDGVTNALKESVSMDNVSDIVKKSLPNELIDSTGKISDTVSSLREQLLANNKELARGVNDLRNNVAKAIPIYEKSLPGPIKNLLQKFADGREEEERDRRVSEAENETREAMEAVQATFANYGQASIAIQQQESIKGEMRSMEERKRFQSQQDLLHSIRTGIQQQVDFQHQVTLAAHQKIIETGIRQLITQRNIYRLIQESSKHQKDSLDSIVKNTALPDIVKSQKTEVMKDIGLRKAIGWVGNSMNDFVSGISTNVMKNLNDKLSSATSQVSMGLDGINMGLDMQVGMAEMLGPVDLRESLAKNAAGFLSKKLMSTAFKRALNGVGQNKGGRLDSIFSKVVNSTTFAPETLNRIAQRNGDEGMIGGFLKSLIPGSRAEDATTDVHTIGKLGNVVPFDNYTRKSIVDIIPELLSKIHQSTEGIRLGNKGELDDNNRLTWDHESNQLTNRNVIIDNLKREFDKYKNIEAQLDIAMRMINIIDAENTLPPSVKKRWAQEMVADNGMRQGFRPDYWINKPAKEWKFFEDNEGLERVVQIKNLLQTKYPIHKGVITSSTSKGATDLLKLNTLSRELDNGIGRAQRAGIHYSGNSATMANLVAASGNGGFKNGVFQTNIMSQQKNRDYIRRMTKDKFGTKEYQDDLSRYEYNVRVSKIDFENEESYDPIKRTVANPEPYKWRPNGEYKERINYQEWKDYVLWKSTQDDEDGILTTIGKGAFNKVARVGNWITRGKFAGTSGQLTERSRKLGRSVRDSKIVKAAANRGNKIITDMENMLDNWQWGVDDFGEFKNENARIIERMVREEGRALGIKANKSGDALERFVQEHVDKWKNEKLGKVKEELDNNVTLQQFNHARDVVADKAKVVTDVVKEKGGQVINATKTFTKKEIKHIDKALDKATGGKSTEFRNNVAEVVNQLREVAEDPKKIKAKTKELVEKFANVEKYVKDPEISKALQEKDLRKAQKLITDKIVKSTKNGKDHPLTKRLLAHPVIQSVLAEAVKLEAVGKDFIEETKVSIDENGLLVTAVSLGREAIKESKERVTDILGETETGRTVLKGIRATQEYAKDGWGKANDYVVNNSKLQTVTKNTKELLDRVITAHEAGELPEAAKALYEQTKSDLKLQFGEAANDAICSFKEFEEVVKKEGLKTAVAGAIADAGETIQNKFADTPLGNVLGVAANAGNGSSGNKTLLQKIAEWKQRKSEETTDESTQTTDNSNRLGFITNVFNSILRDKSVDNEPTIDEKSEAREMADKAHRDAEKRKQQDNTKEVTFDVYVNGEETPRLLAYKLLAGDYVDDATGDIIRRVQDIKGPVRDIASKEMVITEADIARGLTNQQGDRVFDEGETNSILFKLSKGTAFAAAHVTKFTARVVTAPHRRLMGATDVYCKDDLEKPILSYWGFLRGEYRDYATMKPIRKVSQIKGPVCDKNRNIILTEEHIQIGLCDKKGRPLRGYWIRRLRATMDAHKWLASKIIAPIAKGVWKGSKPLRNVVTDKAKEKVGGLKQTIVGRAIDSTKGLLTSPFRLGATALKGIGSAFGLNLGKQPKAVRTINGVPVDENGNPVQVNQRKGTAADIEKQQDETTKQRQKDYLEKNEKELKRREELRNKANKASTWGKLFLMLTAGTAILKGMWDNLGGLGKLLMGIGGSLAAFGSVFGLGNTLWAAWKGISAIGGMAKWGLGKIFGGFKASTVSDVVEDVLDDDDTDIDIDKDDKKKTRKEKAAERKRARKAKKAKARGGKSAKIPKGGKKGLLGKAMGFMDGAHTAATGSLQRTVANTAIRGGFSATVKAAAKRGGMKFAGKAAIKLAGRVALNVAARGALVALGPIGGAILTLWTAWEVASWLYDAFQSNNKMDDFRIAAYGVDPTDEDKSKAVIKLEEYFNDKLTRWDKDAKKVIIETPDKKALGSIMQGFMGGEEGFRNLQANIAEGGEGNVGIEYCSAFSEWVHGRFTRVFKANYEAVKIIDPNINYKKAFGRWGTGELKDAFVAAWARRARFAPDNPENPYGIDIDPFWYTSEEDAEQSRVMGQGDVDHYFEIVQKAYIGDENKQRNKDHFDIKAGKKTQSSFAFEQTEQRTGENANVNKTINEAIANDPNRKVAKMKDGSNAKVNMLGNTVYLLDKKEDLGEERVTINDATALRMRVYGLLSLVDTRVNALRKTEQLCLEFVKYDGVGNAYFENFNPVEKIFTKTGAWLNWDTAHPDAQYAWLKWFQHRFSPAYLAFLSLVNQEVRSDDPFTSFDKLSPNTRYDIATQLIQLTVNMDGEEYSIWRVQYSPVMGLDVNMDSGSVSVNHRNLRDEIEQVILTEKDLKTNQIEKEQKAINGIGGTVNSAMTIAELVSGKKLNDLSTSTNSGANGKPIIDVGDVNGMISTQTAIASVSGHSGLKSGTDKVTRAWNFRKIMEMAQKAGDPHPEIVAAQWALESAWGTKESGKFNYFGILAGKGEDGVMRTTREIVNGKEVVKDLRFANYKSLEDGIRARVEFIKNNPRYRKAGYFDVETAAQAALTLQNANYAGESNTYAQLLVDVMKGVKVNPNDPYNKKKYDSSGMGLGIGNAVAQATMNDLNKQISTSTSSGTSSSGADITNKSWDQMNQLERHLYKMKQASMPMGGDMDMGAMNYTNPEGGYQSNYSTSNFGTVSTNMKPSKPEILKALIDEMTNRGYDFTEQASFIAQAMHETGNFKFMEELGKREYFNKYDGRMGNGPGEGYKYRGRGLIQLTGKENYLKIGKKIGIDLVNNPDLVAKDPKVAALASLAWWENRKTKKGHIRDFAKAGNVEMVSKLVNGGTNGLQDRIAKFKAIMGGNEIAKMIKDRINGGGQTPGDTGPGLQLASTNTGNQMGNVAIGTHRNDYSGNAVNLGAGSNFNPGQTALSAGDGSTSTPSTIVRGNTTDPLAGTPMKDEVSGDSGADNPGVGAGPSQNTPVPALALKAVFKATSAAGAKSKHRCAAAVRSALQGGGYPSPAVGNVNPGSAWMYAKPYAGKPPPLQRMGFTKLDVKPSSFTPKTGDVAVIDKGPLSNPKHGHICIYDGRTGKWVSDFVQNNLSPYRRLQPSNPNVFDKYVTIWRDTRNSIEVSKSNHIADIATDIVNTVESISIGNSSGMNTMGDGGVPIPSMGSSLGKTQDPTSVPQTSNQSGIDDISTQIAGLTTQQASTVNKPQVDPVQRQIEAQQEIYRKQEANQGEVTNVLKEQLKVQRSMEDILRQILNAKSNVSNSTPSGVGNQPSNQSTPSYKQNTRPPIVSMGVGTYI